MIDWHSYRAMLVEFGVSSGDMKDMTLGQFLGMCKALRERQKGRESDAPMSDADFDALKDYVRGLNLPDVRI